MSLLRQTRRGREYLDFYERSEIKSLVTRDRIPHFYCAEDEQDANASCGGIRKAQRCRRRASWGREHLVDLESETNKYT